MPSDETRRSASLGVGERERWDRRYSDWGVAALQRPPAEWLVENESLLAGAPGRRALDVACGDGRNAGYLARFGLVVDAVDVSDVAVDALRVAAAAHDVSINPLRVDLTRDALPASSYDVVVQFNYLQRDLFPKLSEALTPGGVLIVETMLRIDGDRTAGHIDGRFLLEPGELRTVFPGVEIVRYREGVFQRHKGARALASLVARRP